MYLRHNRRHLGGPDTRGLEMTFSDAPEAWRAALEDFARRVKAGDVEAGADGPTFRGLDSGNRAAVHDAARLLGLASKSEGNDDDNTRAVRVLARKRPAWTHASAGIADGDVTNGSFNGGGDTAAGDEIEEDPHGLSAFHEPLPDLRSVPFDMYKALRIPKSKESGGYSGGTARARASYHKEAVKCYPTSDKLPGRGACDGCGGSLQVGRWLHRPAPKRADAPADDPEFGLMDDEEDNDGDAIIAASSLAADRKTNDTQPNSSSSHADFRKRRRDLCPPCFHREFRKRPGGGNRFGDETRVDDPKKDFTAIESFTDLGRERPRYDVAAYAAFRERRAAAADAAAEANARALAAVAGPEALERAAEIALAKQRERDERTALEDLSPNDLSETRLLSDTTRFAHEVQKFQKVTIAYLVLRDSERQRVLDEGGYKALAKSESHLENDVFDCDPWDVYERFFKGEDEEDRQYLLLHGGGEDSDEEGTDDEDDDDNDDDDDDDAFVESALGAARHERWSAAETADRYAETMEAPPPPPISVLMSMNDFAGAPGLGRGESNDDDFPGTGGVDVWRVMAERYGESAVRDAAGGEARAEDETDEDDEEDDDEEEEAEDAAESDEIPDPWTDVASSQVMCMGCPGEEDGSSDVSDPDEDDDDDDGPPEEAQTKRKRTDDDDAT